CDNLRFGLSPIDSHIPAGGNPQTAIKDQRTKQPWPLAVRGRLSPTNLLWPRGFKATRKFGGVASLQEGKTWPAFTRSLRLSVVARPLGRTLPKPRSSERQNRCEICVWPKLPNRTFK